MSEQWRSVVGWEGLYEVSDQGRVRSLDRVVMRKDGRPMTCRGKTLATPVGKRGYPVVNIKGTLRTIHSLVMPAFVGTRPVDMDVRHLNGDKMDNRPSNLRYGTRAENIRDQLVHGTQWQARKTHCPQGHPYDEQNTIVSTRGSGSKFRICKTCHYARQLQARRAGCGT